MSRTLAGFAFLLIAAAIPCTCRCAEEPAKQGGAISSQDNRVERASPVKTYTGNVEVTGGGTGWLHVDPIPSNVAVLGMTGPTASTPTACHLGKVFYIITEGAGLGDNVRCVPCTGKETVMDALSVVNGPSQVSGTKMWIARPSPTNHDKSTILPVDWEAVAKRGINTTNYTLLPGDRFVIGQDPEVARANLLNKKVSSVERCMGMLALTCSTLNGWDNISAADKETMKEFLRKGVLTDDEGMKNLLGELIRQHDLERAKARSKEAEKSKPGQ